MRKIGPEEIQDVLGPAEARLAEKRRLHAMGEKPARAWRPRRRALGTMRDDSREPAWAAGYRTRIVALSVNVEFVEYERYPSFGRMNVRVSFRVTSPGPDQGKLLLFFIALPREGAYVARNSDLYKAYKAATGLIPPKHVASIPPSDFLAGGEFLVRVRTVERGSDRKPLLEGERYSVVDFIEERISGTPRILGRRGSALRSGSSSCSRSEGKQEQDQEQSQAWEGEEFSALTDLESDSQREGPLRKGPAERRP